MIKKKSFLPILLVTLFTSALVLFAQFNFPGDVFVSSTTGPVMRNDSGSAGGGGSTDVVFAPDRSSPLTGMGGSETGSGIGFKVLDSEILSVFNGGVMVGVEGGVDTYAFILNNQDQVQWREATTNGTNYKGFQAPGSVTANTTCVFENDASFIPYSCVGTGADPYAVSDSDVPDNITTTKTKCINIDPSHTTTDWLFFRTDTALTITGIDCLVDASTSVAMTLRECNSNGASCGDSEAAITCGTTNTTEASSIDDASVDAGDWLRVTRGTKTGSPTQANLCVTYTSAS